jgi:hypothetical protein
MSRLQIQAPETPLRIGPWPQNQSVVQPAQTEVLVPAHSSMVAPQRNIDIIDLDSPRNAIKEHNWGNHPHA